MIIIFCEHACEILNLSGIVDGHEFIIVVDVNVGKCEQFLCCTRKSESILREERILQWGHDSKRACSMVTVLRNEM